MGTPLLSLSTFGIITNPAEVADLLLTHFVYAMKSQTSIFGNNVSSLPYILEQNANNMAAACVDIQKQLQSYYARYFASVDVSVSYAEIDSDKSATAINIKISMTVKDTDGVEYQLGKMLRSIDGKFKEFITLNNESPST